MPGVSRRTGKSAAAPEVRVRATVRTPLSRRGTAALAGRVLLSGRREIAALSVAFIGPARMKALNHRHLGHADATDVIAFALPDGTGRVVGDVYICPAVAAKQAARAGTTLKDELRRLVIHGTLHVLGHTHEDGAGRMKGAMWRLQERLLARYGSLAP
jgi:probable rRNA maturation factor